MIRVLLETDFSQFFGRRRNNRLLVLLRLLISLRAGFSVRADFSVDVDADVGVGDVMISLPSSSSPADGSFFRPKIIRKSSQLLVALQQQDIQFNFNGLTRIIQFCIDSSTVVTICDKMIVF